MNLFVSAASTDAKVFQVFPMPKQKAALLHQNAPIAHQTNLDMKHIQPALFGNILGDFVVVQPLQFNIERDEDGSYVVSDDIFLVYGDGENEHDALNDYVTSLIDYYYLLEKNVDNNPFDRKQFAYLQTYMQPKAQRGYDAIQATRD
jgi:hypothetical protein